MCILRNLHASHWILGLGLLAAVSGCDSTSDVTANVDPNNKPGEAQREARQKAFGKAGLPVGKEVAPPKAK
jgi:hypothetical protein